VGTTLIEFELSDEHRMLRRSIQEFRDNEMRPLVDDLDPDATHLPKDQEEQLREKAKEQGFWAMGIPQDYGGGGLDILGRAIVLEELV
jgi:acyl-CoA dehydrogenase